MKSLARHFALPLLAAALAACGGSGAEPAASQAVNVGVEPASAEVTPLGVAQFAATVTGTADIAVVWEVVEPGGGAVDATGQYVAPATPGTFHVRARSRAAPEVSAAATVVVRAPVAVAISPKTTSVTTRGTVSFAATVTNASDTSVTWSVPGAGCGSITASGVYTAPAVPATCTVVATSRADPARSDSATVTVTAPPPPPPSVAVSVTPSPAAGDACTTIAFAATVTGASDTAVTWSVQEGAAGGSITPAGVYTLPPDAGTWHVVATSRADPSKSAIVPVTVSDRILSVAVSPANVQLAPGETARFTATVTTTCGSSVSTSTVTAPSAMVAR